jgi:S1-C subfamily serine protease
MSNEPPAEVGPEPWQAPPTARDDWTSPLWGRPDTVASDWAGSPPPTEPPPPPTAAPPPARRPARSLLVTAGAALLAVSLVGGVLLSRLLAPASSDVTAASSQPGLSAPLAPLPLPTADPNQTSPGLTLPDPNQGGQSQSQGQGQGQSQGLTTQQSAAAAAVSPALVDIVTTIGYDEGQGAGTGVVLSSDGIVLTNHHVVVGATAIAVTDVGNGRTYQATVLGYDRSHDVAVLRLSGASGLATARLGDSSRVAVGDAVVAVGNAGGTGGTPSAVAGSVTGLNQSITAQDSSNGTSENLVGLIQVDAAIQPGDSGGALIDAHRTVVGIITAGSFTGVSQSTATEGYAIPIATAHAIAQQILAGSASPTVHIGGTAFLGIQVQGSAVGATGPGVLVAGVIPGSAAAGAGLVPGDVITAADAQTVDTADQLTSLLSSHHPGDTVTLRWTDLSDTSHTATVKLRSGPVG